MSATLNRLIEITSQFCANRPAKMPLIGESAICQDAYIFGIDLDDYVDAIENEFGQVVLQIPWLRFTDQTASFRGCAVLLVPPWLLWRLVSWPFRGGRFLPHPDPLKFQHRLTLRHIAAVIDRGEWFEP